jgi:hypothetical protein
MEIIAMLTRMQERMIDREGLKEAIACLEKTEARLEWKKPASVEMKPETAHEAVPLEDTARMPVGEPRKRRRDRRHLAAQRRQKKEQERTQSKNGCRKDLVAARRGVTRRAQVARRRVLFTMKTRDFHASRKNAAVACRGTTSRAIVARQKLNEEPYEANRREFQAQLEGAKTTAQRGSTSATDGEKARHSGMAWCKGHNHEGPSIEQGRRKNQTRDKVAIGTRRLRTLRKSLWTRQEGRNGSKDLSGGPYVASRSIKSWTLWRG